MSACTYEIGSMVPERVCGCNIDAVLTYGMQSVWDMGLMWEGYFEQCMEIAWLTQI